MKDCDFVRCGGCGLLRRARRPTLSELQSELEKIYVVERPNDDYESQVGRALNEMPFLREHLSARSKGRSLDVGCGLGGFLFALRQEGMSAVGLDALPKRVAGARIHGHEAHAGRFNRQTLDLIFQRECFDLISLRGALAYMDDQGEVFKLARERLKPGGLLYISEHLASSPYYWFGSPLIGRIGKISTVFFDRRSLLKAFSLYGFKVLAMRKETLGAPALLRGWSPPAALRGSLEQTLPRVCRLFPGDYLQVLVTISRSCSS